MENIKKIEDMSLNAWPSHKMELYDGWILRFSYFYTHRTNSVEQFGVSTLPWREKVAYCENVYKRLGSPAIFKISPVVSPDFDYTLENRGYEIQHTTEVMTMALSDAHIDTPYPDVTLTDEIPDIWINSLFDLKGMTNPIHRAVVPSMYRAIPKETICLSEGMKKGAEKAYLQVVQGNTAAKNLYTSLGFTDSYTYWFRVQPDTTKENNIK